VTFRVENRQIYSLLGPNGWEKTMLSKILIGDELKSMGEVFYEGTDSNEIDTERFGYRYGISKDEVALISFMTVDQHFDYFLKIKGMFDPVDQQFQTTVLKRRFGLEAYADVKTHLLSYGLRRRLAHAIALICRPKLILLEEPSLGLDPLARRDFMAFVRRLQGKMTTMIISNSSTDVEQFCNKAAILTQGRIVGIGTPNYLR